MVDTPATAHAVASATVYSLCMWPMAVIAVDTPGAAPVVAVM